MTKQSFLNKYFKLKEHGTDVKTEILAGMVTFVAMAYIIIVNPSILADAGMPIEAVFVATIAVTSFTSLLMGLWANLPIGVAPAMGLNAFFAYYACGTLGLHWTTALGAVFFSGVFFLLLTVTHIRQMIIDAVPLNLKYAIVVGIGLFLALIGFKNAGIVVDNPATLVALGSFKSPEVLLACLGILLTSILLAFKAQGAMLYSIIIVTILSLLLGVTDAPKSLEDIISFDIPSIAPVFMQLDLQGALNYGLISLIFSFTFVELFNNLGALIGLLTKANLMDEKGKIKGLDRALVVDSVGTMASGIAGTSTVVCYGENAAGIIQGGRTGLCAVTIALLFICALPFAPLIKFIPAFATAPALIIVGAFMLSDIKHIDFSDITESIPAFLLIVIMPFTYSIANGFAIGFMSYVLIKIFTGRVREISLIMFLVSIAFFVQYAIL